MSRFITSGSEHVQKVLRDPETPKPEKIKKFWSFVKSFKKDVFVIV